MPVWLRNAVAFLADATDHRFIHTICKPDELGGDPFKGDLGRWTPCFIDLALIGEFVHLNSSIASDAMSCALKELVQHF
jgi:hypothetical protein